MILIPMYAKRPRIINIWLNMFLILIKLETLSLVFI